ncbi:DUF3211 domain-containing protein [Metallosphaera hakonensis]|uniref:Cyclic nucleotide-binding domain-containing protein n=1 Tax=Metallosphaera hakonensis JCM 8857 = DSM 7519 TaxID=1293036 RepID=A0A2U9IRW8_9CREN|nr:DUF3211 domain-containing protein [Metallosphaera hakonensis]AWR98780.1 DUF3211 domain-containing protein [Metallosphaera hakonensis JCM 8857 = DSM 7519]
MEKTFNVKINNDKNTVWKVLSDPSFVLPRLFPPIKGVSVQGTSYDCEGKYLLMKFFVHGTVLVKEDIVYTFYLSSGGGKGNGRLTFKVSDGEVEVTLKYEGWMEMVSGTISVGRWFSEFAEKLDDEITRYRKVKI